MTAQLIMTNLSSPIPHALHLLLSRRELSAEVMEQCIGVLMDGAASEIEIAALLTALAMVGETAEQLTGAARAMRARATPVVTSRTGLLDTCGTGGDRLNTFNISTAAALVVAATGVPVAKHGNRSATSSSGSAEVLQALGVNIELTPEQVGRCVDEVGIGFCYARLLHSAMKYVAPVRQALKFRTLFNLLGPLCNPAKAEYQLIGTTRVETAEQIAHSVAALGTSRTLVVCGNNELDEVSLWGVTEVFEVENAQVRPHTWTAGDFGLGECDVAQIQVNSPAESAEVVRGVFENQPGPARDMVVANAAAALIAAGRAMTPMSGAALAEAALTSGAVLQLTQRLVQWTTSTH